MRSRIAITMGDPAGTGPELITKAWSDPDIHARCRPVVVGDAATLARAQSFTGTDLEIRAVADITQADPSPGRIEVLDLANVDLSTLQLGKVSPHAGEAAFQYIRTAAMLAMDGKVGAIVTNAINKEALNKAGHHYDGHTGLLTPVGQPHQLAQAIIRLLNDPELRNGLSAKSQRFARQKRFHISGMVKAFEGFFELLI